MGRPHRGSAVLQTAEANFGDSTWLRPGPGHRCRAACLLPQEFSSREWKQESQCMGGGLKMEDRPNKVDC